MNRLSNCAFSVLILVGLATGSMYSVAQQESSAGAHANEGHPPSSSPVEIEVGTLGGIAGLAEWVLPEISRFQKHNPHVTVRTISLEEPKRYKVSLEAHPELAENVLVMLSEMGNEPSYLSEKGMIVPIDSFLPDPAFSTEDFYDALWRPVTINGQCWGVPLGSRPDVLLCNRTLFGEAGIEGPPRTWDEFLDYAKRLTKDRDGDGEVDQWGFRGGPEASSMVRPFAAMILQKGGKVMRDGRFTLEDPVCREAYEFWRALVHDSGACKVDLRHMSESIADRESPYGMQILHQRLARCAQGKAQFQLAELPTWGEEISLTETNLYWAIRRSTPERERASWEFVKWMSRQDVSLPHNNEFRGWPCRKDFIEREDFKALAAEGPVRLDVLFRAQEHAIDFGEQTVANRTQASSRFARALAYGVLANEEFDSVAEKAVREANDLLKPMATAEPNAIYR